MAREKVIIANCGGFWGDDPGAARRQVEGGEVHYLVVDYLAEVTMAILQKQRQRRPELGYAGDFVRQLRDVLPACVERGIKVISNAGGVNPLACRAAVEQLAEELGLGGRLRIAVVLGDDIYDRVDEIVAGGESLAHMETGAPIGTVREQLLSANVYLGAAPVARALSLGADIVIAGRVTDTSVTLAPLIHEFGWAADDWDRLAAGIVAGHIIECGAQCTGGNFTDWAKVPSFSAIGYPLVEVAADGSFVVTKHPGSGGLVSVHTVSEQLVYEMGAPEYLSPDCTARFDSIRLSADGPDRVRVEGVRGGPPPERYKVSASFSQGYRAFGRLLISGPQARAKAELVAEQVWASAGGEDRFQACLTQMVGLDSCHPSLGDGEPGEILLQLAVRDGLRERIERDFAPQVVPKVLATVPGITYLADQGRPRASEVVGYWPALIGRDAVPVEVELDGHREQVAQEIGASAGAAFLAEAVPPAPWEASGRDCEVELGRLCLARSGDKGDTANVGVIARSPEVYHWMVENLTVVRVRERFAGICHGEVERFEVPNLLALNFLLHHSLGGGGTLSLLIDAQGKTYAQYLLAMTVVVDEALPATIPAAARAAG